MLVKVTYTINLQAETVRPGLKGGLRCRARTVQTSFYSDITEPAL